MTIDGKLVGRKTNYRVYQAGPPDYAAIIGVFVIERAEGHTWFGGATKSEFAEFLVHFPAEEDFSLWGKLSFL